jgi:gliding motility-associated-like protein
LLEIYLIFVWMNHCIRYIVLIIVLMGTVSLMATHNRAGEITYKQISANTIEMTITTYTKNSSVAADRDSLEVFWGDGTQQYVKRDPFRTRLEPNDTKVNFYITTHTYPGAATYTVSFTDPNRIGNILNVNFPNSIDIPFFLSTTFTLLDQQFQGFNSSAILLQPPIDIGCVHKVFVHNPNAYDADGDSLAFSIGVPLQAVNTPVPFYRLPDEIGDPVDNELTINPITGELRWLYPKLQGEYNIAIVIKEYRKGVLINTILRDMQVLIRNCDNEPPIIESIEEICVIAGQTIEIPILVSDPDADQKVKLSATGGPFIIPNPAVLQGPPYFTNPPFNAKIIWQTDCSHITKEYYKIVLRAADNFYLDSTGLATLKTIRIKVIGPPPENLKAQSITEGVRLTWTKPYACEDVINPKFQGFSIWRKQSSTVWTVDTCAPGLSNSPYTRIVFNTTSMANGQYEYVDTKVENGVNYCYRIQAEFAKLTAANNPFNRVEGLPSREACIISSRDLPLLTKVSVESTDNSSGRINIAWTKPLPDQLDTISNPGPYTYEIYRADDSGLFQKIQTVVSPFLGSSIDTTYTDIGLNTLEEQYTYTVKLYSRGQLYGESPPASSVFLELYPTDRKNVLNWSSKTPWANTLYDIYRKNSLGSFELIGSSNLPIYEDKNLINGINYCYYIQTKGSYNVQNIIDPIINLSQESCATPIDNVPPCSPDLLVSNICDKLTGIPSIDDLVNTLEWTAVDKLCPEVGQDVESYNIYFTSTVGGTTTKIAEIKATTRPFYLHTPEMGLQGCYTVTSVDLLGNESSPSQEICVENCPFYSLPNTFTPNGDGSNDQFTPKVNIFVNRIDLKIYNEHGNLVFQTTNPEINWDGNLKGRPLADGTYSYICRVYQNTISGVVEQETPLSGFIHLLRN